MLRETGFCSGIENYSRHLNGTKEGEPPYCLMDFFTDDFLIIIDESHMTIPQIRGMYAGDCSRKNTLVDYGFRLPSALDNRPLKFDEFEGKIDQMLFVSATPNEYEREHELLRAEQIIRPTGLLDPEIEIHPVEGQIDDLIARINAETEKHNKVLVTTLTKRMAALCDIPDTDGRTRRQKCGGACYYVCRHDHRFNADDIGRDGKETCHPAKI